MRNLYTLIFLLFTISLHSQAVDKKIESLQSILKKSNGRTFERVHEVADLYSDTDLKKAQVFANEEIAITKKNISNIQLALGSNTLGNILQFKSELDSPLVFTKKSIEFRIRNKDSLGIADPYNNMGIIFNPKADDPQALKPRINQYCG